MKLLLSLSNSEEEKLLAKARAEGTTPEQVVRKAIAHFFASKAEEPSEPKKPLKSLLGICAQYGPGPSAKEIDENRAEMFSKSKWDDI